MMKIKQIRELTDAELAHTKEELLKEKLNLNIQARTGQLENSARMGQIRKEIARINTEVTARSAKAQASVS